MQQMAESIWRDSKGQHEALESGGADISCVLASVVTLCWQFWNARCYFGQHSSCQLPRVNTSERGVRTSICAHCPTPCFSTRVCPRVYVCVAGGRIRSRRTSLFLSTLDPYAILTSPNLHRPRCPAGATKGAGIVALLERRLPPFPLGEAAASLFKGWAATSTTSTPSASDSTPSEAGGSLITGRAGGFRGVVQPT